MKKYFSFVKFSHTVFALPFALIGFFLAVDKTGYENEWTTLFLVIACMVFARSAAMGFNRLIDHQIDKKNPRTAQREIPAGKISVGEAGFFVGLNSLLFIGTTYLINPLCFYLSPLALLVVLGYSLTKRFTSISHLFLGLGLALAPVGAYLAVSEQFAVLPVIFGLSVLFWVSGFDILYSLQDEEFDNEMQLYSIPSAFGKDSALWISRSFHFVSGCLILYAGFIGAFGIFYWVASLVFWALLVFQHAVVGSGNLEKINLAFFKTNGLASVVFGFLVIIDLVL